jgi:hypothetical protein
MKYIIILTVLVLLGLYIYKRMRPYIRVFKEALRVIGKIKGRQPSSQKGSVKLVRCSNCGVWVTPKNAIPARVDEAVYCSTTCAKSLDERSH